MGIDINKLLIHLLNFLLLVISNQNLSNLPLEKESLDYLSLLPSTLQIHNINLLTFMNILFFQESLTLPFFNPN